MTKLERQLELEKHNVEQLEMKQRDLIVQLDNLAQRETEVHEQAAKYEKELTILKHGYKEVQRKAENESELRRKTEKLLTDVKKRLDDEQSKRTREMNNNQQHNDKINMLEKQVSVQSEPSCARRCCYVFQVSELQEKLKVETENCQRLRKQAAELTMAKSASEQMAGEFQTLLKTLQLQRDSLQAEVASLQGQLTQEKSSRTQASDHQQVLENRIQSLHAELEQNKQRESKVAVDNMQLVERISSLEKECAGLELELKAAENRYQQEVKAHEETEKSRMLNKEEANLEVVKGENKIFSVESNPTLYFYAELLEVLNLGNNTYALVLQHSNCVLSSCTFALLCCRL